MTRLILVLFTLSGMCALIYQLLWTRWLGLLVGNFATATATVVTVFMAGLALGNWLIGRISVTRSPKAALMLYAVLEIGLTALAALSPALFSSTSPWFPWLAAASEDPLLRAFLCFLVLLPPTILMGGTLPALVQTLSATAPRALGPLYAFNTLGGACGPVLAAFILMPELGLKVTLFLTCALNAGVAATAFWIAWRWPALSPLTLPSPPFGGRGNKGEGESPPPTLSPSGGEGKGEGDLPPGRALPAWVPYALGAFSGFLALAFEIALTRAFVLMITGGSVYGFALILTSYLLGLALGASLVRRWPPQSASGALMVFAVAQGVVWLFSLTTPFWDLLPPLLVRFWWLALPFWTLQLFNFLVILSLTLVLTTAFGYTLPALAAALPKPSSASIGRLFAANMIGAVIGAPLAGFVLLPSRLELSGTLLVLGSLALLAAAVTAAAARPRHMLAILIPVPFLVALSFVLPPPDKSVMNAGMYNRPHGFKPGGIKGNVTPIEGAHRMGKIIYQKDSLTGRIAVRAVSQMEMSFVVNGKPDGSTSKVDMYTQILMAHLPALIHPAPKRVLVIGLGTGTTTGCLTLHPEVEEIHVVEIEPAQVAVSRYFRHHNYNVVNNLKVHFHLDDARHFLLTDESTYDMIVSEPSNLWVSGMVNLFTKEFYESVRQHLNPGGVFFQWIHYYRVAPQDTKGMLRTFQSVFPHTMFWIHQYGDAFLMGRIEGIAVDMDDWERRLASPALTQDLKRIQISPPAEILSFFLWGPKDIERYASGAVVITDDFPYPEFTTPRLRYMPQETKRLRVRMKLFGPLDPMPLKHESTERRLQLGDWFMGRGSLARAKAEYRQALAINPGSADATHKLARLEDIEKGI